MAAIVALMLLQAAPAAAAPPDVAAMVETYRQRTSVAEPVGAGCVGGENDEILVCGKTDAAMRIPLPEERAPDPNEPYHGEPRLDPGRPCPPTGCTGVDFIKGATFLYRLARKIIDPDS